MPLPSASLCPVLIITAPDEPVAPPSADVISTDPDELDALEPLARLRVPPVEALDEPAVTVTPPPDGPEPAAN